MTSACDAAAVDSNSRAVIAISVLLVLLILVSAVGAFLYVRYYCQRPLAPPIVSRRTTKQKQVMHSLTL